MNEHEPWLRQQLRRYPRAGLPVLAVALFIPTYVAVYKGIEVIKVRAQSTTNDSLDQMLNK